MFSLEIYTYLHKKHSKLIPQITKAYAEVFQPTLESAPLRQDTSSTQ